MFNPKLVPYAVWSGDANRTAVGNIWMAADVPSPQLGNTRNVFIYLPPGYTHSRKRYPVLYMHDGQNLIDAQTSFAGTEWGVDETLESLGKTRAKPQVEAIVVGLWNTAARKEEYMPFRVGWNGTGPSYLAFLTDTIKPWIDDRFRTKPGAETTVIMGSSLGGLISMYAAFNRPDVFGLCAALSPALWPGNGEIMRRISASEGGPGKVYVDWGTREPSGRRVVDLLLSKGYAHGSTLKFVSEQGGQHNEAAWSRRFPGAVSFLLG